MPSAETTRLVILDPSIFFYQATQTALAHIYKDAILYGCDETGALQAIGSNPALILIGPNWTPPQSLHLCRAMRRRTSDTRAIIVSAAADEPLFQTDAAYSGASACLTPFVDAETIAHALDQAQRGATLFAPKILRDAHQLAEPTKRELELLRALAQEKTDREIADELCLSEHTVGRAFTQYFSQNGGA